MICMSKDTSLLAEVFQNFRSMCLKIYKLDPANKFSAFGIAWQAALKKTAVKLDLLTDIDMLIMINSVNMLIMPPRKIASQIFAPWMIEAVVPEDKCPQGKLTSRKSPPPIKFFPKIIAPTQANSPQRLLRVN